MDVFEALVCGISKSGGTFGGSKSSLLSQLSDSNQYLHAGINEEEMADSSLLDDEWNSGDGAGKAYLTSLVGCRSTQDTRVQNASDLGRRGGQHLGVTFVHFSAQRKHLLWDILGDSLGKAARLALMSGPVLAPGEHDPSPGRCRGDNDPSRADEAVWLSLGGGGGGGGGMGAGQLRGGAGRRAGMGMGMSYSQSEVSLVALGW
jgi:hypothetical protein